MRATGTSVPASAVITRYSRSTACAEGSSLPGGLRRSTYVPLPAASRNVGIRLPALELLHGERAGEAGHVLAQVALERGHVEAMRLRDRPRADVRLEIAHRRR